MLRWWRDRKYVKAKRAGVVTRVQTGLVEVGGRVYDGLTKTHVTPGQSVERGQVIGKKGK